MSFAKYSDIKRNFETQAAVELLTETTSFWDASGKPISAKEFIEKLFNTLPDFFKSEEELRIIWSKPETRKILLNKLKKLCFLIQTRYY